VSLSKGLERDTHLRMTEVIKDVLTEARPGEGGHGGSGGGQREGHGGLTVTAALQRLPPGRRSGAVNSRLHPQPEKRVRM
jgi:hypothetical protein